jgi:cell division protein FtsW
LIHTVPAPLLRRSDASWWTEWRRTLDWGLVAGIALLVGIGLLMSLAVGPSAATRLGYADSYHFIYRQAVHAAIAMALMLAVSVLDRKWARRIAILSFLAAVCLMALIAFVGREVNGAQSWLRFGSLSMQPSEVVKPGLIVLSAWLLSQRERYPAGPWTTLSFAFFALTLALFLLQPDVGGAALLSAAFLAVFFVSGLPKRWLIGMAAGGAGLAVMLYNFLPNVKRRVDMIFNPSSLVDTFQIDRAEIAIQRGGLFGTGPGEGLIKMQIPEAHTDFIFAVIAEEFGLIAIIAVLAIFGLITIRGFRAASRIEDASARTAAAGLFALFGIQAIINIGVNLAIIPPTGLTLPFISYGGSAMVGMALTIGLALALVRGEGTRSHGPYG